MDLFFETSAAKIEGLALWQHRVLHPLLNNLLPSIELAREVVLQAHMDLKTCTHPRHHPSSE
jgi:hypothetical protein